MCVNIFSILLQYNRCPRLLQLCFCVLLLSLPQHFCLDGPGSVPPTVAMKYPLSAIRHILDAEYPHHSPARDGDIGRCNLGENGF